MSLKYAYRLSRSAKAVSSLLRQGVQNLWSKPAVRAWSADAIALIVISIIGAAAVERWYGQTWEWIFWSRLSSMPVNFLTASWCGKIQDKVRLRLGFAERGVFGRSIIDAIGFLLSSAFFYLLIQLFVGWKTGEWVDWVKIRNVLLTFAATSYFLGLGYCAIRDGLRRRWQVQ